jgi:acyl-homoserine lactone acylase PvdQ
VRFAAAAATAVVASVTCVAAVGPAAAAGPAAVATNGRPVAARTAHVLPYRAQDYADGQAMSILPPGENGLVNATQLTQFETTGSRPANSQDQLEKYAELILAQRHLTDATLTNSYDDESFGVRASDVTRTESPEAGVTIVRDTHDVPHIYGATDPEGAFGAGYAQAEDRLFLMDVLRHYGAGTLSSFLGPSCADEQMDHDELLLAPYTQAQAQQQISDLPKQYGHLGTLAVKMLDSYVAGINAYIAAAQSNPALLPADYAAAVGPPQPWSPTDVVSVAGLIGGIFGKGGGTEVANSALYRYLIHKLGKVKGQQAFLELKDPNDPSAPTTVVDKRFPYEIPGKINPRTTAIPDSTKLTGGPTDTTPGCQGVPVNPGALATIASLQSMPQHMSNALVVDGKDTKSGHPIAVFGPQVSYFAPQILSEEEISTPDYHAEGASFPGTGLVELGRGEDYAWSATSAGSDLIDQRLEKLCKPGGGTPSATQPDYLYKGKCRAMTEHTFSETGYPKPGGTGSPTTINHDIYLTRHGVVQGWTTSHGQPVAVVNQRSTYGHDIDSIIGFLRWGDPKLTHSPQTWFKGAEQISYTFNWFYVDNQHAAYYVSGADPIRPSDVYPALPTWGTGNAEWKGFLAPKRHVHEVDPRQGFFVSWNNKPAPGFAAADDQYGYGPVYRSQLLVNQLRHQLNKTHDKVTRANVVQAMSTASTQDLDGVSVLPQLLAYVKGQQEPKGVAQMLGVLKHWARTGAHRIEPYAKIRKQRALVNNSTQYRQHAAIAAMDELEPDLIEAVWNHLLAGPGISGQGSTGGASVPGYAILPMQFTNTPNSGDTHLGSAYDGGWEGNMVKTFEQLRGQRPPASYTSAITSSWCGGHGPSGCRVAIDKALLTAYRSLVKANHSKKVTSWTKSSELVADENGSGGSSETMPQYDAIAFRAIGVVGQPDIEWQNRPTFQQVIEFPRHRPRK